MKRQTIPRTDKGKLEYCPDGLDEFADKVANDLLNMFPDIDAWDLQMMFQKSFGYSYTRAFLRETADKI